MGRGRSIIIWVSWGLVFLWVAVIHCMWGQMVSGVACVVPNVFERICRVFLHVADSQHAVFSAFFVLGMLVSHAFARNGMYGKENWLHTVLVCIMFAISEEIYQLLIPGHSVSAVEVGVNGIAIVAGIMMYALLALARRQVG